MTLIISFIVISILMKWSHDLKPETFQSLIFELIVKTTVQPRMLLKQLLPNETTAAPRRKK